MGYIEFECVLCERDIVIKFDEYIAAVWSGIVFVFDGYSVDDIVYGIGSVCVSPDGSVVVFVVCVCV